MFKRVVAILASTAVLALLITPPANAAGPDKLEGYAAGSNATALAINLIDQELAFAATTAAISSVNPDKAVEGPVAMADGAALLVAGTPVPSGAPSKAPGGEAVNEICTTTADAGEITGGAADGVGLNHACVLTSALVDKGAPGSSSESEQLLITLDGLTGTALEPLFDALDQVLTPLLTTATQNDLCGTGGLLEPIPLVCDTVNDLVNIDALIDEILDHLAGVTDGSVTVAQLSVAPSLSKTSATSTEGVVAQAGSTGVDIELFPGIPSSIEELTGLIPDANVDDALLKVSLGNATAQVVRDPVSGDATPSASAAQLLDVNVTDSLGILSTLLEEDVPNLLDSLAAAGAALSCDGGALADLLCIDLGKVNELDSDELKARGYDFGEGTVGREATAAGVFVLPVLGNLVGGESVLSLELSQASAAANAIPAQAAAPPAEAAPPLPRTGGDVNTLVALGLFAAAAAGLAAIRRTRNV